MTQDEIVNMAKEAGFFEFNVEGWSKEFERFATLVAAHEREACAKVCDENAAKAEANGYTCKGETFIDGFGDGSGACAAAIRARGEK